MNLRDLRYLVALADERHFGKAAERCFVSQPTLSAQIRKLEDYLGVPLVERQPKRVALTVTGVKIVQRARLLLQEADAIVELAKTDRDPLAGPLKLALIPTVGPYLLPHIVGHDVPGQIAKAGRITDLHPAPSYVAELRQHFSSLS